MSIVEITTVPGDYNGDGVVNTADYVVWRDLLGASVTLNGERPDAATPGVVDAEDYEFWKTQFPDVVILQTATDASAVPEATSSCLLLGMVLLGGLYRRQLTVRR